MFTRLALTLAAGISGLIVRRQRSLGPQPARRKASATGGSPPKPARPEVETAVSATRGESATAATTTNDASLRPLNPPEDHFRRLRPRPNMPPAAAAVAKSLPLLGVLGAVVTLALAVGAVRGELPFVGSLENANPALASALVTISLWAVYLLWKVPRWQAEAWARTGNANPRELFEIENESRGTLGQIISGVAVLTGLIFAYQQLGQTSDNLRVSEEGQITDRFTRAVEQLGSDDFTVRLGGIYALERIARDSPRDYGPVMEVLTAFVRQESPLPTDAAATPATSMAFLPREVKAVLKVIGRRTAAQVAVEMEEGSCLDLTGINAVGADLAGYNLRNTCWDRSDLRGAALARAELTDTTFDRSNLQGANLDGATAQGASLTSANLESANLSRADLSDANLLAANLSRATLQGTNLTGADLLGTNLENALLLGADLTSADLVDAKLTGTVLSGSNLAGVEHVTAEQLEPAIIDGATTLPDGVDVQRDL